MSEWVAVYGAVVATVSIGWQIYTALVRRRTKLKVSVSNALLALPDGVLDCVEITVVNDSDHPVRITSAGLELPDGRSMPVVRPMPIATIPGRVEPHDAADTYLEFDALVQAGLDMYGPIVAFAIAADGKRFKSKPVKIRSR